jgi:hypothetical protein
MPGMKFDEIYNHVPNHIKDNFRNLPEVKSLESSKVDQEEYPGYFELMKANDWYGPF